MRLVRCPTKAASALSLGSHVRSQILWNPALPWCSSIQTKAHPICAVAPLARDPTYLRGVERSTKLLSEGSGRLGSASVPR